MQKLITAAEVAAALGVTVEKFYRCHTELREQHNFPKPVPGFGRLWDPKAIENWLASLRGEAVSIGGITERQQALQADRQEAVVLDWQAELDARAARMGGVG
jgi:predicted DNA-binding transcriptional regulator AlpA